MAIPFPVVHCPALIRAVADEFKDFMTTTNYRAFTAVLCGAVFDISGYSDIMRYILFSPSVTAIWEFFDTPDMYQKLNRRHRRRLLRIIANVNHSPSRYQWVVDDTLIEHNGKKIWGSYNWHDHVDNGYKHGHKLLVLGLLDKKAKLLIPVFWEILHQDLSKETGEKTSMIHEKGWQVALRLLRDAVDVGFPRLVVTADSWFSCKELFQELQSDGFMFEMEIKSNRKVACHGRKCIDTSIEEFFSDRERRLITYRGRSKFAAEAVVMLNDFDLRLKAVAVCNKRNPDDKAFAYYVTNKLTWNASIVWSHARDRWGIEVQFRELKQFFTLGEAAVRSKKTVETSISVALIALTVVRLEQIATANRNENQHIRPIPAGSIVRDLQMASLQQSISKLASTSNSKPREKFHKRINHENLNRKPAETRRKRVIQITQGIQREVA